ncbi:MAG: riboflavin biosynthesis protein RibF [Gemmatimonadota bacterium]|nr:riboflavin biosynthesis protein RibF [Gemmatimonadota bacterium]
MSPDTVLTVGSFDGLHLGHRMVLGEIAERAQRSERRSMVVTFVPHPLEVVNPQAAPPRLTLDDERRELFAQSPVDAVAFLPFTRALSQYTPEAFVELLLARFGMRELVIGHDHGFGRGRSGDEHLLQTLGETRGFTVDVVPAVAVEGRTVSSTLIRRAIAGGDLETAARQLGRRYAMIGDVVRGEGRGRTLGFPTINVEVPDRRKLLPPNGVYAVHVEWDGGRSGAMMHMGPRPTFSDDRGTVEAHLFDQAPDLYGRSVKVTWLRRLRDVRAFANPEALRTQLALDRQAALASLGVPPGQSTG